MGCGFHRSAIINSTAKRINFINNIVSSSELVNNDFRKSTWINNTIISMTLDACHMDMSTQFANAVLSLTASSDIADFFEQKWPDDPHEDEDPDENDLITGIDDEDD